MHSRLQVNGNERVDKTPARGSLEEGKKDGGQDPPPQNKASKDISADRARFIDMSIKSFTPGLKMSEAFIPATKRHRQPYPASIPSSMILDPRLTFSTQFLVTHPEAVVCISARVCVRASAAYGCILATYILSPVFFCDTT